jgi:translation initiation factor RLI1
LKPDTIEGGSDVEMPEFNVSYKPQTNSGRSQLPVRDLLHKKIRDACTHPQFISDVMKPLLIEQLMDQEVQNLSGGELQRVALCLCLGKVFYVSSLGLLVHLSSCVCHVFSFPSTFLNTFIVSYIPAEFGSF